MKRLRAPALRTVLSLVLLTTPWTTMAQETCDGEKTLGKVYQGILKYACFNQFQPFDEVVAVGSELHLCASIYGAAAGAGMVLTGFRLGEIHHPNTPETRERMREKIRVFANKPAGGPHYHNARAALDTLLKNPNHTLTESFHQGQTLYRKGPHKYVAKAATVGGRISYGTAVASLAGIFGGAALYALDADPTACAESIHQYATYNSQCEFVPTVGPKTEKFLQLDKEEQLKIMKAHPALCRNYQELANKLEADMARATQPDVKVRSCTENGLPQELEFSWKSGEVSTIKRNAQGDILMQSSSNKTKNYFFDVADKGGGKSALSSVKVTRTGFATRTIDESALTQLDPAKGKIMADEDQKDLSRSLRHLYAYSNISHQLKGRCEQFLPKATATKTLQQKASGTTQQ